MTNSQPNSTPTNPGQTHQIRMAEIAFVVVVFFWGITFVFSKAALDVVGPFAYNTMRMTLGTVTLALITGRAWRFVNQSYIWPAFVTVERQICP